MGGHFVPVDGATFAPTAALAGRKSAKSGYRENWHPVCIS